MPATATARRSQEKPYNTAAPKISAADIADMRTEARDYLLAGGAIFCETSEGVDAAGRDEHICNIRHRLFPGAVAPIYELLQQVPDDALCNKLEDAHHNVVGVSFETAYLFGVCVGLEVASLTIRGELPAAAAGRKGGRR